MSRWAWGCLLVFLLVGTADAGRMAFVDPVTGVLKTHGFVDRNAPGDVAISVPDDFALRPGHWKWTGAAWIAVAPAKTGDELRREALRAHVDAILADPAISRTLKDAFNAIKDLVR